MLTWFNVKKTHYFSNTVHYCRSSLKRFVFYKVPPSDKHSLLWLANWHSALWLAEHHKHVSEMNEWMKEWTNKLCIFTVLYWILLCTQSALQSCGGGGGGLSPQPPPVCSIHLDDTTGCYSTTTVGSQHTSYRWRWERVIELIKWTEIIRRPCLTRASGGNLARTPGLHSSSLRWVSWDF